MWSLIFCLWLQLTHSHNFDRSFILKPVAPHWLELNAIYHAKISRYFYWFLSCNFYWQCIILLLIDLSCLQCGDITKHFNGLNILIMTFLSSSLDYYWPFFGWINTFTLIVSGLRCSPCSKWTSQTNTLHSWIYWLFRLDTTYKGAFTKFLNKLQWQLWSSLHQQACSSSCCFSSFFVWKLIKYYLV